MAVHAGARNRAAAAVGLCCICVLGIAVQAAVAQETNLQGTILYNMGKWLTNDDAAALKSFGWSDGGNPCLGTWTGVTCNAEGYVTSIDLANKGLTGSLPAETSVWGGLTGLTSLDLSGNSLGGEVPAAIKAAGPQLATINLSDNKGICGTTPAGVTVTGTGTSLDTSCDALTIAATATPAAVPAEPAAAANTTTEAPAAANTTTEAPAADAAPTTAAEPNATSSDTAPAPADAAAPAPVPVPEAPKAPAPPPTVIANAPICSCALKGFGSTDCAAALKNVCIGASQPPVCAAGDPSSDAAAAEQLGQYLANSCFPGQDMDTSICTCVQNLLGNDCAKARVNLCVTKNEQCLAFQNIIDVNGSSSADAVSKVTPTLDSQCPISEPTVPGVKATMEFPDLSIGQYITRQYTQNVANALSSVTNVPSTSISTLDVRPFTSSSSSSGRRRGRSLLQAGGNGVQATYFLATQDPASVSQKLSAAANDGSLSTKLSQYGISAQAGGLKVQSFLPAPPSSNSATAPGSSGFPLWAIAPIVGGFLLLVALGLLLWCCCCRGKGKGGKARKGGKADEYEVDAKGVSGTDTLPKSTYDPYNTSSPTYTPVAATAAAGVGAAAAAGAAAAKAASAQRATTPEDLPVSRSMKVASPDPASSTLTPWEAPAADQAPRAAPATLAPVKTSVAAPAAAAAAGTAAVGAAAAAGSGDTAAASWKSNVRPASGQLPSTGGATSSMANAGKGSQQAERAKFWAQFQETWQQVRQNQNIHNDEPGSPSSGTNWTDVTGQVTPKKQSQGH